MQWEFHHNRGWLAHPLVEILDSPAISKHIVPRPYHAQCDSGGSPRFRTARSQVPHHGGAVLLRRSNRPALKVQSVAFAALYKKWQLLPSLGPNRHNHFQYRFYIQEQECLRFMVKISQNCFRRTQYLQMFEVKCPNCCDITGIARQIVSQLSWSDLINSATSTFQPSNIRTKKWRFFMAKICTNHWPCDLGNPKNMHTGKPGIQLSSWSLMSTWAPAACAYGEQLFES